MSTSLESRKRLRSNSLDDLNHHLNQQRQRQEAEDQQRDEEEDDDEEEEDEEEVEVEHQRQAIHRQIQQQLQDFIPSIPVTGEAEGEGFDTYVNHPEEDYSVEASGTGEGSNLASGSGVGATLGEVGEAPHWDASGLVVDSYEDLVRRKDEIIHLLIEQGNVPNLQAQSEALITASINSKKASWQTLLKRCFLRFTDTCGKLGIPVFPLSPVKVGLYLVRMDMEEGGGSLSGFIVDDDIFGDEEQDAAALAVAASVDLSVGLGGGSSSNIHNSNLDPSLSHSALDTSSLPPLHPKISHVAAGPKPKRVLKRKTLEQYVNRLTTLRTPTIPIWKNRVGPNEVSAGGLGMNPLIRDILERAGGESAVEVKKRCRAAKKEGVTPKPRGRKRKDAGKSEAIVNEFDMIGDPALAGGLKSLAKKVTPPPLAKNSKGKAREADLVVEDDRPGVGGDGLEMELDLGPDDNSLSNTNQLPPLDHLSIPMSHPDSPPTSFTITSSSSSHLPPIIVTSSAFSTSSSHSNPESYELNSHSFNLALNYIRTLKGGEMFGGELGLDRVGEIARSVEELQRATGNGKGNSNGNGHEAGGMSIDPDL